MRTDKIIGIRADANSEIGTGHVMRCLSVAAALKEMGQRVCFLVADKSAAALLESRAMEYCVLDSDYRNMESELPGLKQLLEEKNFSCILVDSYYVTKEYLQALRKLTGVAYMDDMNSFVYPVDMLINYNIYGDLLPYETQEAVDRRLLLGTAYVPLRKEFQKVEYTVRQEVTNVLITTGGSDKYNLAGRILEHMLQDDRNQGLHYHVVSGAFNQNLTFLKEQEAAHENIHIHQNVTNMSELMKLCDVAMTAGGSTMYELCAVGVPILCFSFVDNQEQIVQTFVQKDMVVWGDDYLREGEELFEKLADKLALLQGDSALRENYSICERRLVDGMGAMRIAGAIADLAEG